VASKIGVQEVPAFQMAAIRQFIAGVLLVVFFVVHKKLTLPTGKQFLWLLLMGILMFVGANGLSTWSLKYIPTGLSSLIGALYPLVVVIFERIFFGQKDINLLTITGLILGIGGVAIVFYENIFQPQPAGFMFGVLLSLGAMLTWCIGTMIIARNKIQINPYYATGWQMLISSGILLLMAWQSQPLIALSNISLRGWGAISYLVVAGSLLSFAAFVYSMKYLPAAIFSLYAYFNPLVAMLVAYWVLGEKLTANIMWGAIVTLLGVFLVNYSIKKNKLPDNNVVDQ
jgi:drug/metabolite transporter (DMT)-like permease